VDTGYDEAIVQPTLATSRHVLYTGLDVGIIDRIFVVFFGWEFPRLLARVGSRIQSGLVGTYAWVLLIGVIVVLGAFTLR
jgi:NADH-quinone oxidoreductase subunit L